MVSRIYTDTSVIGGCEDDEFRVPSRRLLDAFVRGDLHLVLSELTLRELETAPSAIREVLRVVPADHIEFLRVTQPAAELAQRYLARACSGQECWPTPNTLRWPRSPAWMCS